MLRRLAKKAKRWLAGSPFQGSEQYWIERYEAGRTSGAGSYNELAEFKAEVINAFVADNRIDSVMEFGCGDGNQLRLANYPDYTGFDVSPRAVALCRDIFRGDDSKRFLLMEEYAGQSAQLALSLDVVYHLVEDETYASYMKTLFAAAERFVIVYSSNSEHQEPGQARHVRHRMFTEWVDANMPHWTLTEHLANRYPQSAPDAQGSLADFYFYRKRPVG
jgi:SAM-dependent methyltransferase